MNALVDALTQRLQADPYRVDLLIERLLQRAVLEDNEAARQDLAAIQRLGVARTFGSSLARVVEGDLRVAQEADAWLIFDPGLEPTLVEWTVHFLKGARAAADQFFGPIERCVVVELSGTLGGFHHTSNEVRGVGYIKLSPRTSLVEHQAIIAHELGHVYLMSGNRFLDEGIAVFFQAQIGGGRVFVGTEFDIAAVLEESRREIPSLRALLAHDGRTDLHFERLVPDPQRKAMLYAAAYGLADHLLSRLSMPRLQSFFAEVRACHSSAAHPAMVSRTLEVGIEALDFELFRCAVEAEPASEDEPIALRTLIWSPVSDAELQHAADRMRRSLIQVAESVDSRSALARILIRRVLDPRCTGTAVDFAEARSLIHDLVRGACLTDRDRLLLEAWIAIAQTQTAASLAARIVSWEKALEALRIALLRFPDDPEVLCASATLHLRGPEQYGASRAFARTCLESVRRIQGWSSLADTIERSHGLATIQ